MKKEQMYFFSYVDPATDIEKFWSGNFYQLCCKLNKNGKELSQMLRNKENDLPFNIHSETVYTDFTYDKENFHSACQSKSFWNQLSEQAEAYEHDSFGGDYTKFEPIVCVGRKSIEMVFGFNCKIEEINNKYWFVILPKKYYSFIIKKQQYHVATMKQVFKEIAKDIEYSQIHENVRSKVKYAGWLNWYNMKTYGVKFDMYIPGEKITRYDGSVYTQYSMFDIKPHFDKLQYIY